MRRLFGNKGFTLIELIIVIVILGVLAGLAGPRLIGSIKDAKVSTVINNIQSIERTASTEFARVGSPLPATFNTDVVNKLNKPLVQMGFTGFTATEGANNTLDITITMTEQTSGVNLTDLTPFVAPAATGTRIKLAGTFTGVSPNITYTHTGMQ